jgi:hypothetical protein
MRTYPHDNAVAHMAAVRGDRAVDFHHESAFIRFPPTPRQATGPAAIRWRAGCASVRVRLVDDQNRAVEVGDRGGGDGAGEVAEQATALV